MPPHSTALLCQLRRLTYTPLGDAELLRRWLERRDEDAFTALVSRHGGMVLGVCRRVLGNTHDADDVFQAVFLILARKAGTLRHPEALPGWLHGVAVRVACKARAAASRRPFGPLATEPCDPHPDPLDALSARELLALIDREIARLPEVYRLPLVLCDLEERTQAEAAVMLGWTHGSLRGRLLRGRERLRARLARRGIVPTVLTSVLAAGLTRATDASVSSVLAASVTRSALLFSASVKSTAIPPTVAALARAGVRGMMVAKLKLVSAVLLAISAVVSGAGVLLRYSATLPVAEEGAESKPPSTQASEKPSPRLDRSGDPLPVEAFSRLGTTRLRHGGLIDYVAFSADGNTLVSRGWDGMRFWDVASGKEKRPFRDQESTSSIALSPDGKLLALRVNTNKPTDKAIAIRDFTTGRLLRRFGDGQSFSKLLFTPDGKVLAGFGWQPTIELWDPNTGGLLHTLKGHNDIVWSVAFSPDGKTLVSASDDKTIRFWDVASGKPLRQMESDDGVGKIALSADGKFLASIDTIKHSYAGGASWHHDNRVRLWDAATGKALRSLAMPRKELRPGFLAGFMQMGFAPDGKTLLTGGMDGFLRIWDPATGRELRQFANFTGSPGTFAFAPDSKSLAVVDGSHTVRLLDLADGKDRLTLPGHRGGVSSIALTPNTQSVVTMGYDGILCFWEPQTGRELRQRMVPADYYRYPQLRADGRTYLTVGVDRMLRLHDLRDGKELAVLRGHESPFPFALSPDGKTLASTNADKLVRLLDPATGAVRHSLTKGENYVSGMSFTADGLTLVVWDADRIVTVWDVATGKKRRQFTGPSDEAGGPPAVDARPLPYTAALSPDGKLLAFGLQNNAIGRSGVLPVVDTTTGKEVRRLSTGEDGASQLCFSPDGKSLAWGSWRTGTVYLGEIASGRERRRFAGHTGGVVSLVFSTDGKMLISGAEDTTALVWDLTGRLAAPEKFGKGLSAADLATHWHALAGDDAAAAYRAIQTLAADPERAVRYLGPRLHAAAIVEEKQLKQWIADLDSEQFAIREKAVAELEKSGAAALHALRKALDAHPALETRRRLERLIDKQEREDWSPSAERLRSRRTLEVLERAGTPEAKHILTTLANGAPGAWQTLDARAILDRLAKRLARQP